MKNGLRLKNQNYQAKFRVKNYVYLQDINGSRLQDLRIAGTLKDWAMIPREETLIV